MLVSSLMTEMLRCEDSNILRNIDSKMLGFLASLSNPEAEDKAVDRRVGRVLAIPG